MGFIEHRKGSKATACFSREGAQENDSGIPPGNHAYDSEMLGFAPNFMFGEIQ